MNNICGTCENKIENEFINCGAFCGKPFHVKCANITKDTYDFLKTSLNCFWKCESCISLEKNPEITKRFKDNPDATKYDTNYNSDDSDSSNGPIVSIPTQDIYYKTNHRNMGIALILFNHTDIDGQQKGSETDEDARRIIKVLDAFGFDVKVYHDQTYAEIESHLRIVAKANHRENDCLMVVVMSHGSSEYVFAKDKPYPIKYLWKPFLGIKCKRLRNKPKLFFIQNSLKDTDNHDAPNETVTYTIPNTADLLIMYSTFGNNHSAGNTVLDSVLIQSLSEVLEEAATSKDEHELLYLLTAVNGKVASKNQSSEVKEISNFVSSLTKKFKFKTKNNS